MTNTPSHFFLFERILTHTYENVIHDSWDFYFAWFLIFNFFCQFSNIFLGKIWDLSMIFQIKIGFINGSWWKFLQGFPIRAWNETTSTVTVEEKVVRVLYGSDHKVLGRFCECYLTFFKENFWIFVIFLDGIRIFLSSFYVYRTSTNGSEPKLARVICDCVYNDIRLWKNTWDCFDGTSVVVVSSLLILVINFSLLILEIFFR